MSVLGGIIKTAIDFKGFISSDPNPVKAQRAVLKKLLKKARLTAFGLRYSFNEILESNDPVAAFQRAVPFHDYDAMHGDWWHFLLKGHQNVTWPGGQQYFALSSGTTSHKKCIPVTSQMVEAIKNAGMQQVLSLKNFELPGNFFERQILMLGSSTSLIQQPDHWEGEISGISAANIPAWFSAFYKPGLEIASIKNWDEKVARIAQEAPGWDIGSISGIPSWVELMLKEIIAYNKLTTIHDIWPNLQVFTSGGVAFEPYRSSIEQLLTRPLIYIDTYLASEGYLATQKRPGTDAMALIVDNGIFFEFVVFEEDNIDDSGCVKQGVKSLTIEQAQEDTEYVLIISTVAGAWRYMIGDTVIITDKERAEVRISGRTKHYLNVVGEQLSIQKMNLAIEHLEQQCNLHIKEYVASTVMESEGFVLKWILGTDEPTNNELAASLIDKELKNNNKNYAVARSKALKGVKVETVPLQAFYNWTEKYKHLGGQVKIPRVMKADAFDEFAKFVKHPL